MKTRVWWMLLPVVLAMGCDECVYGTGTIYVWNGTDERTSVSLNGRTMKEVSMRAQIGELMEDVVVGSYTMTIEDRPGADFELAKDHLVIVNIDERGCFARADVSGMYTSGKTPVKVLEVYRKESVIDIADRIGVMPGKRLPGAKPKGPYGFQRLAVVPCELTGDRYEVARFVKRLK